MSMKQKSSTTEETATSPLSTVDAPQLATVTGGAGMDDLGLEVVDNDDSQISLLRPVRHIRAPEA